MSHVKHESVKGLPLFLTVGFVGKRKLEVEGLGRSHEDGFELLSRRLDSLMQPLQARCGKAQVSIVGLSSLAMGADTAFGQALSERQVMHRVYLPEPEDRFFGDRERDFEHDYEAATAAFAGEFVIEKRVVSRSCDRRERFRETALEIIRYADLLVAVVSEEEFDDLLYGARSAERKAGGSLETVDAAKAAGTPVLIVNHEVPDDRELPLAFSDAGTTGGFAIVDRSEYVQRLTMPTMSNHIKGLLGHDEAAAFDAKNFDYPAVLHGIANLAKNASREAKTHTYQLAFLVLGLHVAATFSGVVGLMKDSLKAAAPYWLDWVVWVIGHPGMKVALLFAALGVALYEMAGLFHGHHRWLRARRLAEVLTSAKVLVGLDRSKEDRLYRPFAGSLRHLREIGRRGELGSLVQSLNTLHLRERCQSKALAVNETFVEGYCLERIGDVSAIPDNVNTKVRLLRAALFGRDESGDGSIKPQIPYFRREALRGKVARVRLLGAFLFVQALALGGAAWAFVDYGSGGSLFLLLAKFGPVFLPVVGAALIAWLAYSDDERRSQSYPAVVERLAELRVQLERHSGDESIKRGVIETESLIMQDVSAWYERMSSMRV